MVVCPTGLSACPASLSTGTIRPSEVADSVMATSSGEVTQPSGTETRAHRDPEHQGQQVAQDRDPQQVAAQTRAGRSPIRPGTAGRPARRPRESARGRSICTQPSTLGPTITPAMISMTTDGHPQSRRESEQQAARQRRSRTRSAGCRTKPRASVFLTFARKCGASSCTRPARSQTLECASRTSRRRMASAVDAGHQTHWPAVGHRGRRACSPVTNTKVRPGPTGIVFESDDSIAQVRPGRSIVNLLLLQHSRVPPRSRRRPQQRANAAGCGEKLAKIRATAAPGSRRSIQARSAPLTKPAWPGAAPAPAVPGSRVGRSTPPATGPSAAGRPDRGRLVRRSSPAGTQMP